MAREPLVVVVADGARADSAVPPPLAVPARQVSRPLDTEAVLPELVIVGLIAEDLPDLRLRE